MRYLFLKRPLAQRLGIEAIIRTLQIRLYRRRATVLSLLLLLLAALLFNSCFSFGLNASPSLPHTLYLIHKGTTVKRGDYVAFHWHGGGLHPAGVTFVKIMAGLPGDTVTETNRQFFVNGHPVGTAKQQSRKGAPLAIGPVGSIPSGRFYVMAPHPDSLDSRYRLTGWISQSQIIGRAYALF
jgi:conjugal transfer pilin signal peptidase TrbI